MHRMYEESPKKRQADPPALSQLLLELFPGSRVNRCAAGCNVNRGTAPIERSSDADLNAGSRHRFFDLGDSDFLPVKYAGSQGCIRPGFPKDLDKMTGLAGAT